jgi:hypothetical protein
VEAIVNEDRIDGRELKPLTERGSDARLLLGLMLLLAKGNPRRGRDGG